MDQHNIQTPPIPSTKPLFKQGNTSTFKFIGSGGEYFRIWIVNILLTIITLGIYGPWAKVRRLRYFYSHSKVEDEGFDFTGDPKSILKGRIIALIVYAIFVMLSNLNPTVALFGGLILFLATPWLLRATYRFLSRNSKYRNSRFYFFGSLKDACITYLMWPAICLLVPVLLFFAAEQLEMLWLSLPAVIIFYLVYPFLFHKHKTYQLDNLSVGNVGFSFEASVQDFIKAYVKPIILTIFMLIVLGGVVTVLLPQGLMTFFMNAPLVAIGLGSVVYIMLFSVFFWIQATFYQTTWNNTFFGNSPLSTTLTAGRFIWISITNILIRVFTLGLGSPWATVRMHRYKIDSMQITWQDNPDDILVYSQQEPEAFGEELADILDLDISL